MKIAKLEYFQIKPRWLFLKISTDEGICGWGEPVLEGFTGAVQGAIEEMAIHIIGKDPRRIEDLYQTLYRSEFYRGGPILMSAISGIEQACWDIKGKAAGMPVHEMLGGRCRDRIKVYSWIGGDYKEDTVAGAKRRIEQGFRAVKMIAIGICGYIGSYQQIDEAANKVAALREAVGPYIDIGLDFHGRVHRPMVKTLIRALEPMRPLFFEEPLIPENSDALAEIAAHTSIPLATGERLYGRAGFKQIIAQGAVGIIQPDLSHAGGIWECRKIAAMAEAADIAVAPHCPLGPLALASSLQLDACTPNFAIQEMSIQIHYNQGADLLDYVVNKEVFAVKDGYVAIPDRPGLGVEIDEERVRKAAIEGHDYRTGSYRLEDGTVAEW
jgi:galactonate dehydratase